MSVIYVKNPNIVARKIANEMVLVPIRQKTGDLQCIYNLNDVAGRIWELIDDKQTLEDIAGIIVEEYEVEYNRAVEDTVGFTMQLEETGLIKANTSVPD
jgi:hypothetical protein